MKNTQKGEGECCRHFLLDMLPHDFLFSLPTGPTMLSMAGLFLIPGGAKALLKR